MSNKKRLLSILIISFVVVILVGLLLIICPVSGNMVGLQNDGICFEMNKIQVILKKGIPVKKEYFSEDLTMHYLYNEKLYGHKCDVDYGFIKDFWFYSLSDVGATIYVADLNKKDSERLFEQICNDTKKVYEKKEGYYNESINEYESVYGNKSWLIKECKFGTNTGATGESVLIEWNKTDNEIDINIDSLF